MSYNPEGDSREIEYENRIRRTVKKSKMSRKVLHSIFWIALGIGAIITYLIMFFMGNPFSDVAGIFIKGSSAIWVVSTILLWWANATALFFATKWYMSEHWYFKHWLSYIISGLIVTVLYLFNAVAGIWTFIILGGLAGIGLFIYADYYILHNVIEGISKNTLDDDPLYDYDPEEEEVSNKAKK